MDITAWRQERNEDKTVVCRVQVTYKDGRKIKTVLKSLDGWSECGEGYNPRDKNNILIFEKKFKNDNVWKTFLRKFPYRIAEKTPTNKTRIYNAKKTIG